MALFASVVAVPDDCDLMKQRAEQQVVSRRRA